MDKATVEAPPKVHVVQKGDNLWKIAKKYYGNGSSFLKLINANKGKIKAGFLIHPGQEILIP